MPGYRALTDLPALVKRAQNLAEQMEFESSCTVETGRLLQLLVSQFQSGVIGELAAGCGVGSAWIASGLTPSTSFFTVEEDVARAASVGALFDSLFNVRVIQGDWWDLLKNRRFSMIFASVNSTRAERSDLLVQSLNTGGVIVLDGMPPQNRVSLRPKGDADQVREYWLNDPRVIATEIQVSVGESVILATRQS